MPKPVATGAGVTKKPNPFDTIPQMKTARANYQPGILYFYHSDKKSYLAKACSKLNGSVFVDKEVVKQSKKFLCIASDFRYLHKSLRIQFKVKIVPTVVFIDAFSNVLYTLRGGRQTPATFAKFMKKARKSNEKAVNEYKKKMADLEEQFQKADTLLDEGNFEDARGLLEKMTKNKMNADIAEGALARLDEIKMGELFNEGVKALEEKNYDLALARLKGVAESAVENRWASRAWDLSRTIPAAKLYTKALAEIEAGKNYEAMQILQRVTMMEDAGHYAQLATKKIGELKAAWSSRK